MSIFIPTDALAKDIDQDAHQIELDAGKLQRVTGEPYPICLERITTMRLIIAKQKIAEQISQMEN